MSYSDSEDSFHSAQDAEEKTRQRDKDVEDEQQRQLDSTTTSIPLQLIPDIEQIAEDPLSWSERIESDLDLDQLLIDEQRALLEKRPVEKSDLELSASKHTPGTSSHSQWPMNVDQDDPVEMDDSFVRHASLSLPDSPSEPSTDKESGGEMKEWDRLSGNSIETPPTESAQGEKLLKAPEIDQNLLDEWEKGWDDTDITEEDIVAVIHDAKKKSSASHQPSKAVTASANKSSFSKQTVSSELDKPPNATQSQEGTAQESGYWGKWGGWGTNLLTTAVGQVGQGLSAVMDTVEQGLGAPKPEELAARKAPANENVKCNEPMKETKDNTTEQTKGWLADLTTKVQSSGLSLVSNSLDVLEGLGKKTMDVVNEKDPGLKQTKAVLKGKINQPILSQVLREAKSTRFDTMDAGKTSCEEHVSFVKYFDEEQGTGSWEALELLSTQCAERLQSRHSSAIADALEKATEKLEELCQASDYEDSPRDRNSIESIRNEYSRLNIGLPEPHALLHVFRSAEEFLRDNSKVPESHIASVDLWRRNVHRSGVRTFAACTAKSLEQIRKIAEMIFLGSTNGKQDDRLLFRRVESVQAIVTDFCLQLDKFANQYAACLALGDDGNAKKSTVASTQITDMFIEASNSNRYIQDALGLCLPIFKLALLQGNNRTNTGKRTE